MKKRVVFRSLAILLATTLLLSSTSAYNLLVYANQDSVADSISAIESASDASADASVEEPNISVHGGELQLESDSSDGIEAYDMDLPGTGAQNDPYLIENLEDFLLINTIVNATMSGTNCDINTNKHFKLVGDIDLTPLFNGENEDLYGESPFVEEANNAYFVSADMSDSTSDIKYINIDGSYEKTDGTEGKHKIYLDPDVEISIKNYETFALFGYLGENSVISNIVFEDINVSVSSITSKLVSVISYVNAGRIENCEINNCSVSLSNSSVNGATSTQGSISLYNGIGSAVADNRNKIYGVNVNNFTVALKASTNDYIGGLVGQNRGEIKNSSVSEISISVNNDNHYVGGLAGYNKPDSDYSGIQYCTVDFSGEEGAVYNITGGGFVGGLVGSNDGYIYESSVKGTVTSAQTVTSTNYNIEADPNCGKDAAYFGGVTGVNNGRIERVTVSDVGCYMNPSSFAGNYGGIAAITSGEITGCVASGSFVSNINVSCYAGGIIAYADSKTPDGSITDCYALVKINNPSKQYIGAVVGFGGTVDTTSRCYWSDAISGCVTAYVIQDSNDSARPYILETKAGKLISSNRATVINHGGSTSVSGSQISHVFNTIEGTIPATVTVVDDTVVISGSGSNNSLQSKEYKANFSFPAGVGASAMQSLDVSLKMDIFITSTSGDPDDINNPFIISSTNLLKFVYLAPYGHYKITRDLIVENDFWAKPLFTGTIDGDNNTILTDTGIFRAVIGTRETGAYMVDNVTDPELDTADVTCGTLKRINFEFSEDISESILGNVYDATIINVTLNDGDPVADDGDNTSYEGKIAKTTKIYSAPFIDCAVGNSYIYGCSSDVSVELGNFNYTSAFIGFVSGNVYVDNCSITSVGVYVNDSATDKASRAVFISNTENNFGYILNSIVSARIIGKGICYYFIGLHKGYSYNYYQNLVWSIPVDGVTGSEAATDQKNITRWGGESVPTKTLLVNAIDTYSLALPSYVSAFKDATVADFSVSLERFTSGKPDSEQLDPTLNLDEVTVENGMLKAKVSVSSNASENDEIYLKIYHYDTGFLTYVKYLVKDSAFEIQSDGYYHIATPQDLITLSNSCIDNNLNDDVVPEYLSKAYKLVADIDMEDLAEDIVYTPIGIPAQPFTGIFDGNGHIIENLHLSAEDGSNVALFGAIDSSKKCTVNGNDLDAGVYDFTLKDSSFTGGTGNVAAIVGSVSNGSANIHDITITDIAVTGSGSQAAAVLAYSINSNLNIYNISLDNVSVRSNATDGIYFMISPSSVGGIGGIVGSICNTGAAENSVNLHTISINTLKLCSYNGDEDAYAMVNAGALIGTYQKFFENTSDKPSTLEIGKAKTADKNDYNITVKDSLIMTNGMAGGLVGSTNAVTTIVNALVSGESSEKKAQIHSKTDYYIGGIAGYIGHYTNVYVSNATNATDNDALAKAPETAVSEIYGTITDCAVEYVDIKATDTVINEAAQGNKKRNVSVGGIVGAVNGPAEGDTLVDCTVKYSDVEGVVTGGVVGSAINLSATTGNVVHITNCDVVASNVTTPETCHPKVSTTYAHYGVGGIMGTNRMSATSYITDLVITYCDVDENTNVLNYIPYKENTAQYFAATGGIIGSCTQLLSTGVQSLLQYNAVSAYVQSSANFGNLTVTVQTQGNVVRVGTGGFIGMFNGTATTEDVVAHLQKLSIRDSAFDGTVVSYDCIGGAIGTVVNATGRETYANITSNYCPTDLLSNIVISGSLKSLATYNALKVRGGVAIGHISMMNTVAKNSIHSLQLKNANDVAKTFNDVYFSSFETAIDFVMFPFLGFANGNKTGTAAMAHPTAANYRNLLLSGYVDVNCKSTDNKTVQIAAVSNAQTVLVIPDGTRSAPERVRGSEDMAFKLDEPDENGVISHWKGSDESVAAVSDTTYDTLTVTPKSEGSIRVSIDYVGSVKDSDGWSYETKLPVGFVFGSVVEFQLPTAEDAQGNEYYLITAPGDFKFIKTHLDANYWIANDIVFTDDMFADGKSYAGGFDPIGTADAPFTGSLSSKEDADRQYTISGIKIDAVGKTIDNVETEDEKVAALFGYVSDAEISNIIISDIESTESTEYAAAVAAKVIGSLTADRITVENAKITGAKYSAGLFGGLFGDSGDSWTITNSSLIGSGVDGYSTVIEGSHAAAGIVVHSDENPATISGVTVSGCSIYQDDPTVDEGDRATFTNDNGAAGIAVAYSGTIVENAETSARNVISDSMIKGEIAAGAVVRTYTSASADSFVYSNSTSGQSNAALLSISGVDVSSTQIQGTHAFVPTASSRYPIASGGILARVDATGVDHIVSDCTLDSSTTVKAPYAVGGILGTLESFTIDSIYNIVIDGCTTEAAVGMTVGIKLQYNDDAYVTMGAGGVVGGFNGNAALSGVNIRNCTVGGSVSGPSAVGGLIGAIWTDSTDTTESPFKMDSHFAENCVIAAELKTVDGKDAFATVDAQGKSINNTTGIIVGQIYDTMCYGTRGNFAKYTSFSDDLTDQPFFNIYYSGYKYSTGSAYLFGILKPGGTNEVSMNDYSCYTDYIYEINYSYSNDNKNHTIDPNTDQLIFSEQRRIIKAESDDENGVWIIDSYNFTNNFAVDTSVLSFDVTPQSADGVRNYSFDSSASLNGFTLSTVKGAGDGAGSSVAQLVRVEVDTDRLSVEPSAGGYILKSAAEVTRSFDFNLVFVYSNGLELAVAFELEVSEKDYYYNSTTDTYFVFNASNLYSTISAVKNNADATIIQCYDIFSTVEKNNGYVSSANTYADSVSIEQIFGSNSGLLEQFIASKHPNLEYDPLDPNSIQEFTVAEYLGVTDVASVSLGKLVENISETEYGRYTDSSSDHFNFEFKGKYRVLPAVEGVNTGLTTAAGEYYSVYGYELRAINYTAQGSDAINAGFFASLNGATIEGLTFVNPKVKVIASKNAENNVGVLAGSVVNSVVKNISVELSGNQGDAYVMSLRQMTAASTNVGGIAGYVSTTSLENCSVTGLDVVGATLAGNISDTTHYVRAGGVVGIFDGGESYNVSSPSVSSVRILTERNDKFRNVYMSYSGGVAAWATGSITNAVVDNVQLRDVTCDVIEGTYIVADDDHMLVADRIGGVVAYAFGATNISSAKVSSLNIRALDIAGGIIGEIADASDSAVSITDSFVGDHKDKETNADIRIFGFMSLGSGNRVNYSVSGGVVGLVNKVSALTINNCGFSGYVGTYSYDNLNKECTAGGIVGILSEKLTGTDLSNISIVDTTVVGEVSGYRGNEDKDSMEPYLGAAGGYIGKIRSTASGFAADGFISHGVMSATVNLYCDYNGNVVTASTADINPSEVSTNVGKIIGSVIENGNFAESETTLTSYINNIYVSSYPQDIVAYGCMDFYCQNDVESTYTDINKATYEMTDDEGNTFNKVDNSFMLGNATNMSTPYDEDSYSSVAIVPIDINDTAASATRHFRLMHDNVAFSKDGTTGVIAFDKESGASIVTSEGLSSAQVTLQDDYTGKYGTLLIDNVEKDIVGIIVLNYTYGLEVSIQRLISMEIEGEGTEAYPFQIRNANQIAVVRALPDCYYEQVANIDLGSQYGYSETVKNPIWAENGEGFEPIGTQSNPFKGNYDGGGYLITNLYIGRENSNNVGFFGVVGSGAVLENIHIELAGLFEVYVNKDSTDTVPLNGGVTGKNNVGGLAGYVNAATITNCSVVKGNVIGNTAVGGLVGRSDGATIDSSFTSTTSYSKLTANAVAATKNVGALVGMVGIGETTVSGSFTFGYASLGVLGANNEGAVGGLAGFVAANSTLNIDNVLVGANTSEYAGTVFGNRRYYKGMTVGTVADSSSQVNASNVMVSVASSISQQSNENIVVNPILGASGGANISSEGNVVYDVDLLGEIKCSEEINATPATFTLEHVSLATNAGDDSYTRAYVELAGLEIEPSKKEIEDRKANTLYSSGLFYPLTVKGSDLILSSSIMDMTDTDVYPQEMDENFYGNGDNRKTDLLFKNVTDGTGVKVYSNIYKTETGAYKGTPYDNGEMFFNDNMPYFVVSKTAPVTVGDTGIELYRKVVYPIQLRESDESKNEGSNRIYPIATERQLSALSNPASADTKFSVLTNTVNYALTDDIALSGCEGTFNGMETYSGYFEGNGYTVSNLNIDKPETNGVGFIGTMSKGAVRNLTLGITGVSGADNVGALVGLIQPGEKESVNIVNCAVVESDGIGVSGKNNVGGLIGKAYGGTNSLITKSYTNTQVRGVNVVGGLVGYSEMSVDNCYSIGDVNASITAESSSVRGIGGLIGVTMTQNATIQYSFSSSAVEVTDAEYNTAAEHGIGGLVGYVGKAPSSSVEMLSTVFSSGSVSYCNIDVENISTLPGCSSLTIGVGGLVGILCSQTSDVYSSASITAMFGDVTSATAVGAGGVVGVSKATLQTAYSSGSTLGQTATNDYSAANYGVGGVIGVLTDNASGANLYFDLNTSVVADAVDKIISGSTSNVGSKTTKVMTQAKTTVDQNGVETVESEMLDLLSKDSFGHTNGAYPFLTSFLDEGVSRTIKFNALLSVVAIQLNELDVTAANGQGISMAMTIPTGITYQGSTYTYGFEAPDESDSQLANAATSIVDESTNTLSVQRTSNTMETANFIITIKKVNGATTDEDDVVYSTVASRPLSRICAQMLGSKDFPYLVSSQEDLAHVAMTQSELDSCSADSLYKDWNTPLNQNGSQENGMVYYRMMGYIPLAGYERSFSCLTNGYSFDGNGYSVRNLQAPLATTLDKNSVITNVTFEGTEFSTGESLIGPASGTAGNQNGVVSGQITGVNILGTASGNNVAGIAQKIDSTGSVSGCVINLDYTGTNSDTFAGVALENSGTVEMTASVGNISGSAANASALVGTNNGKITDCFTMGDIILTSPTGVVAGFVGINNAEISNCYTRCNIIVTGDNSTPQIGSFAAANTGSGKVYGCYASGLFSVMNGNDAADIKTIFVANNQGVLDKCVFDKQMSGGCFKNDFYLAARTLEVATLSEFDDASREAYAILDKTEIEDSNGEVDDIKYPQLKKILATEEYMKDESGAATADETANSRMYRMLRSYSKLSVAAALVYNDNYIDFLPAPVNDTPMDVALVSRGFEWGSENEQIALFKSFNTPKPVLQTLKLTGDNKSQSTVFYTEIDIDNFYFAGENATLSDRINLHITVSDKTNPNFSGGNGTQENPFIIMDKFQFVALSYYGSNADNNFVIGKDIDFTPDEEQGETVENIWSANIDEFSATLDGKGYTLSNVTIPESGNKAIFGCINGGTVKNLGLAGVEVIVPERYTGSAGMLAAKVVNGAEITNCVAVGTITGPRDEDNNILPATGTNIGGLIGETDGGVTNDNNTVIDGCVVSGKIYTVATNAGGVIGLAAAGTEVKNCLSTVFVSGGSSSVSGGIIGAGTATVTNSVFAGNAVGGNGAGNISGGQNVTANNCFYDLQISMLEGGATPATTRYLTGSEIITDSFTETDGESGNSVIHMSGFENFEGYPVPAAFVSDTMYSESFVNAVKLASAKIMLINGVGSGTATAFITARSYAGTQDNPWSATLKATGEADKFITPDSGTVLTADTSGLSLDQKVDGEFEYTLEGTSMTRYIDFVLAKTVKVVNYKLVSGKAENGESVRESTDAIVSASTGSGNAKSASTAFGVSYNGYANLCDNMVFVYDDTYGAYTITVSAQLNEGLKASNVAVSFDNDNIESTVYNNADGTFTVVIESDAEENFSTVYLDIEVMEDVWGIRKLVSNFFKVF